MTQPQAREPKLDEMGSDSGEGDGSLDGRLVVYRATEQCTACQRQWNPGSSLEDERSYNMERRTTSVAAVVVVVWNEKDQCEHYTLMCRYKH